MEIFYEGWSYQVQTEAQEVEKEEQKPLEETNGRLWKKSFMEGMVNWKENRLCCSQLFLGHNKHCLALRLII